MANPSADYPNAIHTPTDTTARSGSALGSGTTPQKHSQVHGKIESELVEIQKKLGTGQSNASDATTGQVPTKQADGSTLWDDLPGGVPDEAWQELDLSGRIQGSLGLSQAPQFIASSICKTYWHRTGRRLDITGLIFIPADADWGTPDPFFPISPILIASDELPFTPRIYPEIVPQSGLSQPNVGDFSILNTSDSQGAPIADNSMAIGSVITNFGGSLPVPIFTFFHASKATAGNLENLVFDGNQVDLIGNIIVMYFNGHYECAYEEGYMNIANDFTASSVEDSAYSSALTVTTSSPFQLDLTAEVSSGALPTGLSLDITGTTLTLSGTPTTPGEYTFEVTITGANGDEFTKEFTVTITEYVIQIDDNFTAVGMEQFAYSSMVDVVLESEGEQLPISFEVTAGTIPTGLSLALANDTEITLSGTPTVDGLYTFTIEITDTNGATYSKEFTVDIDPYNPEFEDQYLGTVSGNSLNINFEPDQGGGSIHINSYVASPGDILKIRSGTMTHDFGEGPLNVPIGGFIIFEGGYWREYIY